jgi:branched-chain amino acid transport system permease protein
MELRIWQKALYVVVLGALMFLLIFFKQGYFNIFIFTALINGVMAVSYDIPGRSLGLISLGHAIFFGLGAYIFGIGVSLGLVFIPAFILAGTVSFLGAVIIVIPLARLNHGYFALATLGVLFIFQRLAESLEGLTGGPAGLYIPETITASHCGYLALILLAVTILGYEFFGRSRWGLYSRETEADEAAAESIGIPTQKVKVVGLAAAALPATLAGALHLARTSHISPASGFSLTLSITALLASRIVPIRGPLGPLLGALLITVLEEVIWTKFAGFNQGLFGLILLAAALYQGMGKSRNTVRVS